MKTLVISDSHLNDDFQIFLRILFPFIAQIIDQYKIDKIVFLGDIFDTSSLSNNTLFLFKKLMNMLAGYNIEIVVGNHDLIDKKNSAFDLLLLSNNITLMKDLQMTGKYIYLPYISNKNDFVSTFADINKYIKDTDYDEYFIYSHNDFSSLYKFRNTFFNLEGAFAELSKPVYFVNGHNHVSVFLNRDPLYIVNLGCTINLNFKDSTLYNKFLIIDDEADDEDDKLILLENTRSVQYYTFDISTQEEIYEKLNTLDNENVKYVTFKVIAPNINIDNELKLKLQKKYNIVQININFQLDSKLFDPKNIDEDNPLKEEKFDDILKHLNISYAEFCETNSIETNEKVEILYTLLDLMFADLDISEDDKASIIKTVNKHYLGYDKD